MIRMGFLLLLASCAYTVEGPFGYNTITSDYGPRNAGSSASAFHKGIDYGQAGGTTIPAVEAGNINDIAYAGGYGYRIEVQSSSNVWWYCHMQEECSALKTEFCIVALVDTHNVNIIKNDMVLIFWQDKSKCIAQRILSSAKGYYVKYNRKYIRRVDTTQNCITQNNISARESIGPVGKTGGNYPYHLHLGLSGQGQNPLLLIDHNAVSPTLNTGVQQPQDYATIYRKKFYPIRFGVDNRSNKDLDSVSIQLDNNPPMIYSYGGATIADDNNVKVVFFDTTGVWPDQGMGNDRFIYGVDLSNDTVGPHQVRFSATTIEGRMVTKTAQFDLMDGFFVSYVDPLNGKANIDVKKKMRITFSRPLDPSSINDNSIVFIPPLRSGFTPIFQNDNTTVVLQPNDSIHDTQYNCQYKIGIVGDLIRDTSGQALDGDGNGVPGGNDTSHFVTRKPEFDFPQQQARFAKNETKVFQTLLENQESRNLKFRLIYPGPIQGMNNNWAYRLNEFKPFGFDSSYREIDLKGLSTDTSMLMMVSNLGKAGSYRMTFTAQVLDSMTWRYLGKTTISPFDLVCTGGGSSQQGGGGPGGEAGIQPSGPDENWSVSDPDYDSPWLIDTEAPAGVVMGGYFEGMGCLLGKYGIRTALVRQEDLHVFSTTGRTLDSLKTLVIPSGGLRDMEYSPQFWQKLDQYVSNGGSLVVMDQPFGELYSRLPGNPQARGWEEDLS